jgi:hypothetical protein
MVSTSSSHGSSSDDDHDAVLVFYLCIENLEKSALKTDNDSWDFVLE